MDKKTRLKLAIQKGIIKDKKTLEQFIIEDLKKEQIIKEVVEQIPKAIQGNKGDKGEQGERGPAGKDGKNGKNGIDGLDGITPDVSVIAEIATKSTLQAIETRIPTVDSLLNKLPVAGSVFRDGLELLQGEERLSAEAIKG